MILHAGATKQTCIGPRQSAQWRLDISEQPKSDGPVAQVGEF